MRSYNLFGQEEAVRRSEIVAHIEFIPPNVEKINIHKADGTGFGQKIVQKILQSENQILANPTDSDISPRNYRFRFLRRDNLKGSPCYVLEIEPMRKDTNLLRRCGLPI